VGGCLAGEKEGSMKEQGRRDQRVISRGQRK